MLPKELTLENQLCFRIHRVSRLFVRIYQPFLDTIQLTYPQYLVMLAMWEYDKIDYNELAQHLGYQTGTLTPLVNKLVQRDYLGLEKNSEDRRKTTLKLTEKGKELGIKIVYYAKDFEQKSLSDRDKIDDFIQGIDLLEQELKKLEEQKIDFRTLIELDT
jgi:DNA-binding MarR family transcriptional regulator